MNLQKRKDGWKAENVIEFEGARRLSISTYKISGKLVSSASVNVYRGDGMGFSHVFGLLGGGDYSEYVIVTPGARASEKAVREQQVRALIALPQILERAKAHYVKYPPIAEAA